MTRTNIPLRSEVKLLPSSSAFRDAFAELLENAQRLWVVSAWTTLGIPIDLLAESGVQVESVIGTSFNATDPEALRVLARLGPVYIDPSSSAGIFHPKLYLFDQGATLPRYVALAGSPNLTHAAFSANEEIALYAALHKSSAQSLLKYIAGLRRAPRVRLTSAWLATYRRRYKARGTVGRVIAKAEGPSSDAFSSGRFIRPLGTLMIADWKEYLRELRRRSRARHGADYVFVATGGYLGTLRIVTPIAHKRFDRLSHEEFRHLLGASGHDEEVGWFGRLTGGGRGVHQLMHNQALRKAVTRLMPIVQHAKNADSAFDAAKALFSRMLETDGLGPAFATRFLTVSRPDRFFPVNDPNIADLAALFGMRQSQLRTWAGYAHALRLVWKSKWYRSARPRRGLEARAWDARAALLDAYAYRP